MAKIILTGSTGFVGSDVLNKLVELNHSPVIARRSLGQINNEFESIVVDSIDSNTNWKSSLRGCEVVIHCAARVHMMNDESMDPLAAFREVNTFGTLNLARSASQQGVKRFIFISSIKVNGERSLLNKPFRPDDEMAPQDPYGISKAEAEEGLTNLAKETGMEVVIIRPPLVYGSGVKANFAALMKLTSFGIPLPFGCITDNSRSMVYVDNLVDLITKCISHPKAANQTFLLSDDDDLSTARMIKELSLALGNKGWMLPIPVKFFEMLGKLTGKSETIDRLCGSLQVDISKTKQLLDWQPPVSVKDAFRETVSHFMLNQKHK